MNVFNRIVMVLLILGLLGLAVSLLINPQSVLQIGVDTLTRAQESIVFTDANWNVYYRVGMGIVALVLLILLLLEIRRTHKKSVRIKTEGNGKARIGVESVTQSLAYRIDELPGVRDAKPHITSRGKDVSVAIDLHTSPTVNVPTVTGDIVKLAHEIIETQLGVKIHGQVEVNVAHEPFPRGTMAPVAGKKDDQVKPASEPLIPPVSRPAPVTPPAQGTASRPVSDEAAFDQDQETASK